MHDGTLRITCSRPNNNRNDCYFYRNGMLSETTIWSYVIQLTGALAVVHAAGLACRSLDPSKVVALLSIHSGLYMYLHPLLLNSSGNITILKNTPSVRPQTFLIILDIVVEQFSFVQVLHTGRLRLRISSPAVQDVVLFDCSVSNPLTLIPHYQVIKKIS